MEQGEAHQSKSSRADALEAVDFIINVLKEHEKDLDRLITQLGTTLEQHSETGELTGKIAHLESSLAQIQTQISDLTQSISSPQQKLAFPVARGPPVIFTCRRWEDFRNLASEADTVSYLHKEKERGFQAQALKDGRVLTYNGDLPKNTAMLKIWISRELKTPEEKVLEGTLVIV